MINWLERLDRARQGYADAVAESGTVESKRYDAITEGLGDSSLVRSLTIEAAGLRETVQEKYADMMAACRELAHEYERAHPGRLATWKYGESELPEND